MEKPQSKFNVISQWMAKNGVLNVQAVELAQRDVQRAMGSEYAVRFCILDPYTQEKTCVTSSAGTAKEFAELLSQAIFSIGNVATSK